MGGCELPFLGSESLRKIQGPCWCPFQTPPKRGVPTHNKTHIRDLSARSVSSDSSPIDSKNQLCQNPLFVFWGRLRLLKAEATRLRPRLPRASEDLLRQEGLQPGGHRLHGAQLLEGLLLLKGRASAPTGRWMRPAFLPVLFRHPQKIGVGRGDGGTGGGRGGRFALLVAGSFVCCF